MCIPKIIFQSKCICFHIVILDCKISYSVLIKNKTGMESLKNLVDIYIKKYPEEFTSFEILNF